MARLFPSQAEPARPPGAKGRAFTPKRKAGAMVEIRLRNSMTRKVEPLEPTVIPGKVSMYVCGPTVYDRAHLGNARPVVVFDVLYRLLRHVYGAERHLCAQHHGCGGQDHRPRRRERDRDR
jgi:hypothetical protein